jgi:hypothetical protein
MFPVLRIHGMFELFRPIIDRNAHRDDYCPERNATRVANRQFLSSLPPPLPPSRRDVATRDRIKIAFLSLPASDITPDSIGQ